MQRNQSSFTDPEMHPVLTERSIAYLQERAVPHDIAKAAGLSSLTKHQIEYLLARDGANTSDGLGIPYKNYGEVSWRVRLDEVPAQQKKNRWRWSKGEPVRPYLPPIIPPETWQNIQEAIIIVEGPVKALAVWSATGIPCIGLAGVDTGHDTEAWQKDKTAKLCAELLARIEWQGRKVYICFDAGRLTNPQVANGEARIALALKAAGAEVYVIALPELGNGKEGPDDFIVARSGEAFTQLVAEALLACPVLRMTKALEGSKREAIRLVYAWLDDMPFVASMAMIRHTDAVNAVAWNFQPQIPKKIFTEKISRFSAILLGKTLAAEKGGSGVDQQVVDMNLKHAVVCQGPNITILHEKLDPKHNRKLIEFVAKADLEIYYANQRVLVGDGKNSREISIFRYWLHHPQRRTFDEVVFNPGKTTPEKTFNLWTEWPVAPREGDWSLLKNHIRDNICAGNKETFDYVLAWMADGIQNPTRPPGTALVLRGREGTGKGVFVSNYGALFGSHFLQVSNPKHFLGNFNAHLANCLMLFADEAFWAGDKSTDGILKALITEPTIIIERKGQDAFKMDNLIRMIMASNNDWAVPAGLEARRFVVLDVATTQMQNEAYFIAIQEQMAAGGKHAMMQELKTMNISGFSLRKIPKTKGLLEQKISNMSAVQQFWYNRLREGNFGEGRAWSESIPTADIYATYVKESQLVGERRRSRETEFGIQLKKLVPSLVRRQRTVTVKEWNQEATKKVLWCYEFPTLEECRKQFAELVGDETIDWDEESGTVQNMNASTHKDTSPAALPKEEDIDFGF